MHVRLSLVLFVLALGTMRAGDLASGKFLVASRDLGDPNFAETVVLVIRYGEDEGALGLIVNRRSDVPLSRLFVDLKAAKAREDLVYAGGPVDTSTILALLKTTTKPADSERMFGDVYFVSTRELLEKTLASDTPTSAFHVFAGYAGWGPGQLEHEIALGGWHVVAPDASSVFHTHPDSVWERLIRRTELQIAGRRRHRVGHHAHA